MKINTLIFFFCAIAWSIFGQQSKPIFILSGSVFTMGESVSGCLLFDRINIQNKIFKIEVSDTDGTIQQAFYVKGEAHSAHFSFDLPYLNSSTGYRVSVHTLGEQQQDVVLAELPVLCLHTDISDVNAQLPIFKTSEQLPFTQAQIIKVNAMGEHKVVVQQVDADDTVLHLMMNDALWDGDANAVYFQQLWHQPEVNLWPEKIFIQGHLEKKSQAVECKILGLFDHSNDRFLYSKADVKGQFIFLTDTFYGLRSYQLMPYGSEYKQAVLAHEKRIPDAMSLDHIAMQNVKSQWQDYQMKNKIDQYFNLVTIENKNTVTEPMASRITAQKTYIPDNFKSFDLFHQFCKENEVPLQFKLKDKKYDAQVNVPSHFAKQFQLTTQEPLFCVNGYLTKNDHLIATLKTTDIASFDLYYDVDALRKAYNIFGAETIIRMKTKSNVSLLNEYEKRNIMLIKGLTYHGKDNQIKVKEKIEKGGPVFEPHLYFGTPSSGQAIYTTDDKTKYNIHAIVRKKDGSLSFVKQSIDLN